MTAVILAAGMGSRYGGLKQLDPVGRHGEFIIDYSVYDCIRVGFDKIVFIIKEENREIFDSTIGERIKKHVKIEYVFQSTDDLPNGFSCPPERSKPWGTAHALRSCRNVVDDKFIIFNADDFYGRESFDAMHDFLSNMEPNTFAMPGYTLANTLSENGHVARGVCVTENGYITKIRELKQIMRIDGAVKYEDNGEWKEIDGNSPVSMNFWAFTPDVFKFVESGFENFLRSPEIDPLKSEYYITDLIAEGISSENFACKVVETPAKWMGVTYRSDKPEFEKFLNAKIDSGEYPDNLWGN